MIVDLKNVHGMNNKNDCYYKLEINNDSLSRTVRSVKAAPKHKSIWRCKKREILVRKISKEDWLISIFLFLTFVHVQWRIKGCNANCFSMDDDCWSMYLLHLFVCHTFSLNSLSATPSEFLFEKIRHRHYSQPSFYSTVPAEYHQINKGSCTATRYWRKLPRDGIFTLVHLHHVKNAS
jgi:hypothetical protein